MTLIPNEYQRECAQIIESIEEENVLLHGQLQTATAKIKSFEAVFKNTEYPKRATNQKGIEEEFSVDVITFNENNMLNIGYWNYDMNKWLFHTDTLSDPYEGGRLEKFVWMYKPEFLTFDPNKDE